MRQNWAYSDRLRSCIIGEHVWTSLASWQAGCRFWRESHVLGYIYSVLQPLPRPSRPGRPVARYRKWRTVRSTKYFVPIDTIGGHLEIKQTFCFRHLKPYALNYPQRIYLITYNWLSDSSNELSRQTFNVRYMKRTRNIDYRFKY